MPELEITGPVGERPATHGDWFNPSIAHQLRCSLEALSPSRIGSHELYVNWFDRSLATHSRGLTAIARTVLRCFRCGQRYEREIHQDSIAALTCLPVAPIV